MGISLSHTDKIVSVTSPTTIVTIQELVTAIRDWEDELENLTIDFVCWTDGKSDQGGGVYTAISLKLNSEWQIQFWSGVGVGIIKDGNLSGGVGGDPVKETGGSDTVVVNNQIGGVIIVTGDEMERDNTVYTVLTKNARGQTLTAKLEKYTDNTKMVLESTKNITITYDEDEDLQTHEFLDA